MNTTPRPFDRPLQELRAGKHHSIVRADAVYVHMEIVP